MGVPIGYRRWVSKWQRHDPVMDTPGRYFYEHLATGKFCLLTNKGMGTTYVQRLNLSDWHPDYTDDRLALPEGV